MPLSKHIICQCLLAGQSFLYVKYNSEQFRESESLECLGREGASPTPHLRADCSLPYKSALYRFTVLRNAAVHTHQIGIYSCTTWTITQLRCCPGCRAACQPLMGWMQTLPLKMQLQHPTLDGFHATPRQTLTVFALCLQGLANRAYTRTTQRCCALHSTMRGYCTSHDTIQ